MKYRQNFFHKKFWDYLAYFLCLSFFVAGSVISVIRYWQYDVFYYDFGIFDRAIWLVSRFQAPVIDHMVVGGKWIFADHFSPSIFLLSPVYWFTTRSEAMLIAQSLAVTASGLLIYLIACEILKNKLLSFAIVLCYFLFLGLQNAIIADIHEVTIATFFITLNFWAYLKKRNLLYFFSLFLILGFKESIFLYGIFLAITIVLIERKVTKLVISTILICSIWGFLSIKVVIPYFSGGLYQYSEKIELNLLKITKSFFDYPQKRRAIFYSLVSFGFLPILSPEFWPLILQDFFSRFYPFWPTRWDLSLHYSAILSVSLAISSTYGIKRLFSFKKVKRLSSFLAIFLIIVSIFLYRFKLHGPFGLAYNPAFYNHSKDFKFLDNLVNQVPSGASVMAPNNLASHFTHQKVWLLRRDYGSFKPDYILIDIRDGQNANNFFYSPEIKEIVDLLKKDSSYELVYTTSQQFVFRRK